MAREVQVAQVFVELLEADAAAIVLLEELDPSRTVAVSIEEAERVLHPL